MIGVIAFTGYWVVNDRAQTAAQRVWLDSKESVPDILKENRVADLEATLQKALAAAATLGKDDEDVHRFANLHKEAQAANSMISIDFSACLNRSYDKDGQLLEGAEGIVLDLMSAGTFVFDTKLQPASPNGNEWGFELPAIDGKHAIKVVISDPPDGNISENTRLLFAARIQDVERPTNDNFDTWQLTLNANSFALLTSESVAEYIGLPMDQDLKDLLQQQESVVMNAWGEGSRDNGDADASSEPDAAEGESNDSE